MDEDRRNTLLAIFQMFFTIGLVGFLQLLPYAVKDLAIRYSPIAASNVMDFVKTPIMVGGIQLCIVQILDFAHALGTSLSVMAVIHLLRGNVDRLADFISKSISRVQLRYPTHAAFFLCAWIHLSASLVAGGNIFWVASLSGLSVTVVSAFKFVANYEDCSTVARWVLAQSVAITIVLICQGHFQTAVVAILPIIPAIIAMRTLEDKIYSDWPLVSAPSVKGGKEKGSKSNECNADTTPLITKVATTIEISDITAQKESCQ